MQMSAPMRNEPVSQMLITQIVWFENSSKRIYNTWAVLFSLDLVEK